MTDGKRGAPQRPGGKLLADALVAQGVTHAFCVPGESYLDLLDGLYAQRNRVQLVTCRFEAGAVHMAEAYGKLTGKPGVAIVTRGPGTLGLAARRLPEGHMHSVLSFTRWRKPFSVSTWLTVSTRTSGRSVPPGSGPTASLAPAWTPTATTTAWWSSRTSPSA